MKNYKSIAPANSSQFLNNSLDFLSENLGYAGLLIMILVAFIGIKLRKKKHKKAVYTLDKAIKSNLHEPTTLHPDIDPTLCAGCGTCVKACPEGEILQLINHKAVLVYPSKCVGHGVCEIACPLDAINLVFGTKTRGMDIPRISADYETNMPGLYIAGELGGMGLIRNAVKQGRLAAYHAATKIKEMGSVKTDVDLFIVGAGPAGFAASLAAKEKGLVYKCIDQNTFGGTIYNFPRQKIVTSHPLEFPMTAPQKFKSNIVLKEEILAAFNKVREQHKVEIDERVVFNSLKKLDNGTFEVETTKGKTTAKKVMLCMGVRGSPRRLGLPNEDLPKVTYNLIDPEEYQNCSVAIVGGGNAGLECAQYLSKPHLKNEVHLVVRGGPSDAFAKANEGNQKLLKEQVDKNLVIVHYDSSIKKIETDHVILKLKDGEKQIKNDFIFVFAGAEVPFKFLMSLGIEVDKAHGEVRK